MSSITKRNTPDIARNIPDIIHNIPDIAQNIPDIALVGSRGVGKDTVYEIIKGIISSSMISSSNDINHCGSTSVINLKLAGPLHEAWSAINYKGLPKDRDFFTKTARLWKEMYGEDVFIEIFKKTFNTYRGKRKVGNTPVITCIVCTDVRTQEELDALKELGMVSVYIDCIYHNNKDQDSNIDDTPLDEASISEEYDVYTDIGALRDQCDWAIVNDMSIGIDGFRGEVATLLHKLV